ncbi:MAG TPA: hypothetical protein DCY13_00445 [Verrucomicrobiales bacterium]|nr:hypothetical protein [Verrucomicrobiales bacterium]
MAIALAAGCATSDSGFGSRTAVVVNNRTPKEIMDTTLAVFREKEFEVKSSTKREVVFEKKGSTWQDVTWGGWYGDGVWERADIRIIDYGGGAYMIEAKVRLVRDRSEEFFEDSQRLGRRARKPYQELLNEVKARLEGPPA